jgi:hypothetical protein
VIELTSALTRQECLRRLQRAAEADDWEPPAPSSAEPMLVTIVGDAFTVMNASERLGWRTFRRHFYGRIAERPAGLSISGRFRLHPAARLALTVWFGSMTGIVGLLAAANIVGGTALPAGIAGWPALLIPTLVLAAAAWLVRWGLAEARRGEPAVVYFLRSLLDARRP